MVQDVNIEFTLIRQTGKSEIATSNEADGWIVGIGSMAEVELRVQAVSQEQLDDDFLFLDLPTKTP
jgi:hypothetical protein